MCGRVALPLGAVYCVAATPVMWGGGHPRGQPCHDDCVATVTARRLCEDVARVKTLRMPLCMLAACCGLLRLVCCADACDRQHGGPNVTTPLPAPNQPVSQPTKLPTTLLAQVPKDVVRGSNAFFNVFQFRLIT